MSHRVVVFVCYVCSSGSINVYGAGANSDDTHERQCLHKMRQRPSTGQRYLHHEDHDQSRCQDDVDQVTAREGKPILIIEEGDTETAAWAQHSLEVLLLVMMIMILMMMVIILIMLIILM